MVKTVVKSEIILPSHVGRGAGDSGNQEQEIVRLRPDSEKEKYFHYVQEEKTTAGDPAGFT